MKKCLLCGQPVGGGGNQHAKNTCPPKRKYGKKRKVIQRKKGRFVQVKQIKNPKLRKKRKGKG